MAWIKVIAPDEATGALEQQYDAAIQRAGRVFNVVSIQSLNPRALEASMRLYLTLMFGPSGLSRAQREMIAVVVSKTNECFY